MLMNHLIHDIYIKYILLIFIIPISVTAWLDPFHDAVKRGNEEYESEKYNDAKRYYAKAREYAPGKNDLKNLAFNEADTDYRLEDYESALSGYQQSVQSEDRDVQKKAFFNSGNAYLKQANYRAAFQAYENSLKIDPHYMKAKKNIEYLLKRINNQRNQEKEGERGDNKNNRRNKKQASRKDMQRDGRQGVGSDGRDLKNRRSLNREQIKKILRSLEKNPVHRSKGNPEQRRKLDKSW
jgi:Ca-activated chloride channel family protein